MGKNEQRNLHQQQSLETGNRGCSRFCCQRCSVGLSRIAQEFNFRCVIVLILSFSVFVSGIFWILPSHTVKYGFEAKDAIKNSATVQAYFRLQKPVSQLIPHIGRLEYDIYGEIGVPETKVAILSMHQPDASNWTDVVFGVLSDPLNVPMNPVSLSVLRSSLIELFLLQSNLTLTTSIFGQPSFFENFKFPGGITVIPMQSAPIWQIPQVLFNFTLYNSITEIQKNLVELRDQLKFALHLRSYENVYVQITNKDGSTTIPPVTVQASVMSDLGSLLPQRLKQLAQTITDSPANLGLDNSVFGRVKSVTLSSYLKGTLHATPPTPSPAPSPEPSISPYPALSPSYSPAPSPDIHHLPPCHPYAPSPGSGSFPPTLNSPAPTIPPTSSPTFSSNPAPNAPPIFPPSQFPPDLSPLPGESYGSSPGQGSGITNVPESPSLAPSSMASPSSLRVAPSYKEIWLLGFSALSTFYVFCC